MKAFEPVHGQEFHVMPDHKDAIVSVNYRNEGQLQFNQGKLFNALGSYNKSLCVAQLGSNDIPMAFGNRAVVYYEAQQYRLCLENIQLARESGYPVDKFNVLNNLEDKCKKSMEGHEASEDDDPWNFFKLSYPANEKIPLIVNCLELRASEQFGHHIITNQGKSKCFANASNSE